MIHTNQERPNSSISESFEKCFGIKILHTLIEKDHLGDRSPEKDFQLSVSTFSFSTD